MKPERRSSGFAGSEGCVRERTNLFVADPCIDFRIDVDEADDVALMKVIQYRRQLMRHIDKGSEVHDVRPSLCVRCRQEPLKRLQAPFQDKANEWRAVPCRAPPLCIAALDGSRRELHAPVAGILVRPLSPGAGYLGAETRGAH